MESVETEARQVKAQRHLRPAHGWQLFAQGRALLLIVFL